MVTSINQYVRPDLIPEYVDCSMIDHSTWNAREIVSDNDSLVESIRVNGLLQPIVVRILNQRFEVVAGNRRLDACRKLHWMKMPCLIREFSDKQAYEVGLIENLERDSLTPIEEAKAFQHYVNERGWGGVSELARSIGKSKEYVSHRMSLLTLPKEVLELISTDKISKSSAHELVWLNQPKEQQELADAIASKNVPTTRVREAVRMLRDGYDMPGVISNLDRTARKTQRNQKTPNFRERKLSRLFDKSVLTLRICILRLDSIIEELESGENEEMFRQFLIRKRLGIHNQIDEFIQFKKSLRIEE